MEPRQIDDEHIIERYLADRLDAAETAAFEAHYTRNPETVRAIERTLRLKEGLAVLSERGELDSLIRARPGWTVPFAVAAGLATAVIGVWLWMSNAAPVPIAGALAELARPDGRPMTVATSVVLARTRSATEAVEIALPPQRGAVELKVFPSARAPGERYRVTLAFRDAAGIDSPAGSIRGLRAGDDGFVTAFLDTAKLQPGRYAISLSPERGDSPALASDHFVIELR